MLKIICDDGKFVEKVINSDFSCNVRRVDIDKEKLMRWSQRFHLNSLRTLLEKVHLGKVQEN